MRTRRPLLPDGKANNAKLALTPRPSSRSRAEKGIAFVDLFTPPGPLREGKNSAHDQRRAPLPEGNRQLAEVIAAAVTGKSVASSPALEPLRQAVLDKDWHWHNRYRATDGNDIWGGRCRTPLRHRPDEPEVLSTNCRCST